MSEPTTSKGRGGRTSGHQSSDPLVRELLSVPTRLWHSHRDPETGVSYVAVMQLDTARAAELGVLGPSLAVLNRDHTGATRVSAVHGDRRVRVANVGSGVFGSDFIYLNDESQEGFVYLSPSQKSYLHLRRPRAHGQPTPPLELTVARGTTTVIGRRHCQEFVLAATMPVPIHWRLWLCADADLRRFAQPVARIMTGSPSAVVDLVAGWGMPVQGALSLGDRSASPGSVSSFQFEQLTVRGVGDEEFNIPPGYSNLRDRLPGGQS
jgi:hypothetical protein